MIQRVVSALKRARIIKLLLVSISAIFAGNILPVAAQNRIFSDNLLTVGDTVVKRIMPKPVSDSIYADVDYSDIHFRLNKARLDISYLDNGLTLLRLDRVIDSLGTDNIAAIEIISQSSPEGSLVRNTWLTENRSKIMMDYIKRVFPELQSKVSYNKITESWDNLAQYVAEDPNLESETIDKILDIIYSNLNNDTKKNQIRNSLGSNPKTGDVYSYLTRNYYPVIRNSGIYILHTVESEPRYILDNNRPNITESITEIQDSLPEFPQITLSEEIIRKRPFLAVKTNMLYNSFFTPDMGWAPIYNFEIELYPSEDGRWTWIYEYEFPWHCIDSKFQYLQILNMQLEARRYFKEASHHSGHYLSAYIGGNLYDICFDSKAGHGYQGEGGGLGLGYGYVLPIGKKADTRWKLEFFIKGGFYMTFYDPYDAGNPYLGKYYYEWYDSPNLFRKRNMVFRWLGPTGAGVSLSYDFFYKEVKDK
ncbi:MAG: DUF3575 domain-containing protein [Bacteroidaceae bacterium]|nr:DUF3575 domain-containing protein [Bacteroidaceae bacterium]